MLHYAAAQNYDLDLPIQKGEIDTGFHAVERGLVFGVEETRILVGDVGRFAAPFDRCTGKLRAPCADILR